MTRRKGEITDKHRDRSHPYQVEIVVPTSGLHTAAEIMYRWAAWHSHATTSAGSTMCWCFCRPEVADAFAMDCGGRRIDRPIDCYALSVDLPDAKELERRASASQFALEKVTGGRLLAKTDPFQEAIKIPFSSFSNPADVALSQGALDRAWASVKDTVAETDQSRERMRLAYIIASFALVAADEEDLARRAIGRYCGR